MRRAFVIMLTVAMTIIVVAFGAISFASLREHSGRNEHAHHIKPKAGRQQQVPRIDGSVDPSSISDIDAHELLFRSLTVTIPNDKNEAQRKASYLRMLGFNDAEASAIINTAYEYKRLIEPLDVQVDNIKSHHWPTPSAAVFAQLTQLQRQKEAIVAASLITPLKVQLGNYGSADKFDRAILNEIKRKTKAFAIDLPTKKVGKWEGLVSNLFSVSAQYAGCDTYVSIYSSTWVDYYDGYIYTSNSYSAPYNNCGHTYTLSFTFNGQTNPSISLWGNSITGTIQTFASVGGYCEQAAQAFGNGNFDAGQNSSQATVNDYVEILAISVSPTTLNTNNAVTASVSYAFTSGATGTGKNIKYHPGYANLSSSLLPADVPVNPSTESTWPLTGSSITFTYSKFGSNTGTFNAYCAFKPGTVEVLGASASAPKTVVGTQQITVN